MSIWLRMMDKLNILVKCFVSSPMCLKCLSYAIQKDVVSTDREDKGYK